MVLDYVSGNLCEVSLARSGRRLPGKCITPFSCNYAPWLETTAELKADGVQHYQELIGVLRWAVEIARVDILLETSLLSTYLAMPREGHLEQALHIFGYLKGNPKRKLGFDPSHPDIDENRFRKCDWSEFYREAEEVIESLRYKLRMFGVPIEGPTNVFCDNEAVCKNTTKPESVLNKQHHSISYHRGREAVAAGTIRVSKEGTHTNLSGLFTKTMAAPKRENLLDKFTY
jgi:hypothetical protein